MKIITHTREIGRLILILFALKIVGCKKSDEIVIKQNFIEGFTYRFKLEVNNVYQEDSIYVRYECFSDIKLTVKDTGDGLECSWKYVKCYIPNVDMNIIPYEVRKAVTVNEGLTVNFLIDENGKYDRIINMGGCRKFIKGKFIDLYHNTSKEWQEKLVQKSQYLMSLDEYGTINALFPEILLHFESFGKKYNPHDSIPANTLTQNPFDDRTLNTTTTKTVDEISYGIAYITENTKIDDSLFTKQGDKIFYKDNSISPILIDRTIRLNYDMGYKVLKESFCKLTILENGNRKWMSIAIVSQNDWAKKVVK